MGYHLTLGVISLGLKEMVKGVMSLQMHFVAGDGSPCSARLRARKQSPDEGEDCLTGPERTAKTVSYRRLRALGGAEKQRTITGNCLFSFRK